MILAVSHSRKKSVITLKNEQALQGIDGRVIPYEVHLYNNNGHTELYSTAETLEDALLNHKLLCEKCGIEINI
jgi:hypothetical protein